MTDVALTPFSTASRLHGWRIAALVLFLGLPLGCMAVAALALTAMVEANEVADHADETARAIVHQLDRRPTDRATAAETASLYLASPNASLARAELQALAARLIEGAGGRLIEVRPAEGAEQDSSGRVSIEIALVINNQGLLELLYRIETGVPVLTVPRLEARTDPASGGQPGSDLDVTLTLAGAWKAAQP